MKDLLRCYILCRRLAPVHHTDRLGPAWLAHRSRMPRSATNYCDRPFCSSDVVLRASGPNDRGSNCSRVTTIDLPSPSNNRIGILSYQKVSMSEVMRVYGIVFARTSQNSRINCLHIPHGLAGGLMSVETASARMSPFSAPCRMSVDCYSETSIIRY